MIEIWTDGCCIKRNLAVSGKGVGGWAWVAVRDGKVIKRGSGSKAKTTNNIMEMKAAIDALEHFPTQEVEIISDSRYLVEGAMNWSKKWRVNNWTRKAKKGGMVEIANRKLWQRLDALIEGRSIVFRWVKGHNGHRFNEMADYLAGQAAEEVAADVH